MADQKPVKPTKRAKRTLRQVASLPQLYKDRRNGGAFEAEPKQTRPAKPTKRSSSAPPCDFRILFAITRENLEHAIKHASRNEARALSSYLLGNGLELMGKLGGFNPNEAKLIIPDSPTDELIHAIEAHARYEDLAFPEVVDMLVQHLNANSQRWN